MSPHLPPLYLMKYRESYCYFYKYLTLWVSYSYSVWYWGWDIQKWAFVYLGHTKVDICVFVVLRLGYA
jgi:hypothetical protein